MAADEIARIRAEALEEAARVAEEGLFPFDVDVWLTSTKKEMTAHTARAIAAAIRALISSPQREPTDGR
jgi:hypothetical protein